MTATLTFQERETALKFATAWTRRTLRGADVSATTKDGTATVTVYDVTKDEASWIDGKVITINNNQ